MYLLVLLVFVDKLHFYLIFEGFNLIISLKLGFIINRAKFINEKIVIDFLKQ